MSQSLLKRFVPRAVRYTLRPQDRKAMRFSLEHTVGEGGVEQTQLLNLSETGVAFIVKAGSEPKLGESIKVEIPIPGDDQIAWWAKVVRIEEYQAYNWFKKKSDLGENTQVVVGLRFQDLPEAHSRAIRRGIKRSFIQAMREQELRSGAYYRAVLLRYAFQFLIYAAVTAAALGFIYYFSLPDANYDSKRGAPWGERFKF